MEIKDPLKQVQRLSGVGKSSNSNSLHPRLPPGQTLVQKWPVLHDGPIPPFDPRTWTLRIFGLVEEPITLTYDEFMKLPKVEVVSDIHCVTRWSLFDNRWEGVSFKEVMKLVKPKPEAKFVMIHADVDYTTNLPLEVLLDDDVLFAYRRNGEYLALEHGWPLRLVVPKRYFWKSAKWVRGLEFIAEDKPGFWESRGYHNEGDPWKEERFA
jgi:DMSO/TMAO reductase YedYZ molybdopterin-dependent catalytic subunit